MSIVGGGIVGVTVGLLQSRFGIVRDVGLVQYIGWGALAGFGGSMVSFRAAVLFTHQTDHLRTARTQIDSLLGATLQQTVYDAGSGKILLDNVADEKNKLVGLDSSKREVVSGLKVLTNNQVNFVSSATVALISGYLAYIVL
jgi:uncharacterized membrane protein